MFKIFRKNKKTERQKFEEKQVKKGQRTFCYCKCGNELVSSDSFVKDIDFVHFRCSKCSRNSKWDFDFPCPILVEMEE